MNNPFRKILDSFSSMGVSSSESALGIDIGTSAIKIVEIKKKNGKAMLETYGAISLGPYQDLKSGAVTNLTEDKIIQALKEVLKQSGTTNKNVALSVPVQSSLIFEMDLPVNVTEKDVAAIVTTEARKYIPVPINEVTLDYFEIPKKELSFEEANNPDLAL
jgi:type IV pilus assembly protein PilM